MIAIDDFRAFAVALAIGLVLGFEREHHEWREHEQSTTAGTRTFAVVTVAGTIAASLDPVVVAAGVLAVSVLVAVGYMRSGSEHIGLTTEAATLAAFLLGALVWHHEDTGCWYCVGTHAGSCQQTGCSSYGA